MESSWPTANIFGSEGVIMTMTRRHFGKVVLSTVPAMAGLPTFGRLGMGPLGQTSASANRSANRSFIGGVQFGLQPFCYHDLAMTPDNRGTLVKRLVQNGMGMVELHATWVEPRFNGPGASAQDARDKLRAWRLSNPVDHYRTIKKEFDDAGIAIFTYYVNMNDSYTDAEID